mgnify:FL=1
MDIVLSNYKVTGYVTGYKRRVNRGMEEEVHETYLQDMNSKYVYPNVFMSIDDTNKVSQYDTDIKKYAEQKKADWILNGGIEKEWDSYLKKMEQYGLSDYLSIKQKYFDEYQKSLSEEK